MQVRDTSGSGDLVRVFGSRFYVWGLPGKGWGALEMGEQDARSGLERSGNGVETGGREKRPRARKAPRPGSYRKYVKARFAEALPEVAQKLLEEAKKGSVAHLKLLVMLGALDQGPVIAEPEPVERPREKTLEEILTESWDKQMEEQTRTGVVAEVFPDTSGD